jgi:glyoxylase-like metal-dependent hydrolase (beta-lactamase superfamily II)
VLRVHALSGGLLELDRALFFPGLEPGTRCTIPIPCFLVVHPRGRLLFDTGIHPDARVDPVARLGEARARRFGIRSGPEDDVASQLARLGLAPSGVTLVANSHLHFDHCGGNALFPRATFLVQRQELQAARDPAVLASGRYAPSPRDFEHPLAYQSVDGEHDVFGDGRVVLVPTPGHTPGHQSLRVRTGRGPEVVLTADACYTREHLEQDLLPGVAWDPAEMRRSLAWLRTLRDRQGATVVFGHDAGQWATLPRGAAALVAT